MKTHSRFGAIVAGALAASALAVSPALADRFQDWDADQSGVVDRDEFHAGIEQSGAYEDWIGEAPHLTRQEFHRAIGDTSRADLFSFDSPEQAFEDWDADEDAQLTRQEFSEGWYRGYDADQDEALDEDEFTMFEDDADERGWFE